MHHSLFLLALAACGGDPAPASAPEASTKADVAAEPEAPAAEEEVVEVKYANLFGAIDKPTVAGKDKDLVELGRMLYYDTRLSAAQGISCNSCHQLDNFGVDNEPTSPGHKDQRGARNSPTVYNAADHIAQFWDGRAADLAEQAKGPILNPVEMAMADEATVEKLLGTIPGYEAAFAKAFPDQTKPVSYDNMATAIATFEKYLLTPGRWDTYLKGDGSALTADERAGLEVFVSTGCTACHMGTWMGGTMYQKLGLVEPYPTEDKGRQEVTGNEADAFMFKVPSLRNIAKTGPYFHDGSVATLDEAVRLMAKHQLGKELSDDDTAAIVTFLGALTGEVDKAYIAMPALPPNGPETPGPVN